MVSRCQDVNLEVEPMFYMQPNVLARSNLVAEATGDRFPMATLFIALQNDEQHEL